MSRASVFYYKRDFLENSEIPNIENWLSSLTYYPGEGYNNIVNNKSQVWFQEDGRYFNPMWNKRLARWTAHEYDDYLTILQTKVQYEIETNEVLRATLFGDENTDTIIYPRFNSCLVNKYSDGDSFITAHRDSPDVFGEEPIIVILSIGDTRALKFTKLVDNGDLKSMKIDKENQHMNREFKLEHNSLFIMCGKSQIDYMHHIDRETDKTLRYSITFRRVNAC